MSGDILNLRRDKFEIVDETSPYTNDSNKKNLNKFNHCFSLPRSVSSEYETMG
jgi:hypothetical protein